jgi:hypothetical protein
VVIRHNGIVIDKDKRTIEVHGYSHAFGNGGPHSYQNEGVAFKTISYLLLSGSRTRRELFEYIYGHCAEGGPNAGPDIFNNHWINWSRPNGILDNLGLKLVREKRAGEMYFQLRKI